MNTLSDDFVESLSLTEKLAIISLETKWVLQKKIPITKNEMIETIDALLSEAWDAGVFNKLLEIGVIKRPETIH